MNFDDWVKTVPDTITSDRLWSVTAYRLALFSSTIGWHDVSRLIKDARTVSLADQLYRSLGSIHANYAEGYSYSTGGNRARYFEYALGSARESRDWYYDARFVLGDDVMNHRLALLARIIQLLTVTIPDQRKSTLRESKPEYVVEANNNESDLLRLLTNVPILSDS